MALMGEYSIEEIAKLRSDLADAKAECGRLLDKTIAQADTISVLNRESMDAHNALHRAHSCLTHLEWGISEYRRIERNAAEARAEQVRDTDAT